MTIEDELRGALDVPVPPATTAVDDVLRRGKRRVAARRAGLAGGVLAVVAVIGVGSVAWRGGTGPGIELATNPATWGLAYAEGQVRQPLDPARPALGCVRADVTDGPRTTVVQRSLSHMEGVRGTVMRVLPGRVVDPPVARQREDGVKLFEIDVRDDRGLGSLRFTTGHFPGRPIAMANHAPWVSATCTAPRQAILADGNVYQLSLPTPDAHQGSVVLQSLSVFRPDGWTIRIDQLNAGRTSDRPTRDALPLTEEELVALGADLARWS